MIRSKLYTVCRADGKVTPLFDSQLKTLTAVRSVVRNVWVGNHVDFSGCVPFTKYVGAENRRVNRWVSEYEGSEEEILPLFIAAYSVNYIICKSNNMEVGLGTSECQSHDRPADRQKMAEKDKSGWLQFLENLPLSKIREINISDNQAVNLAVMLAIGITDYEQIRPGLDLKLDDLEAAVQYTLDMPGIPLWQVIEDFQLAT